MITKYFSNVSVKFNPFSAGGIFSYNLLRCSIISRSQFDCKSARVFLASIPPSIRQDFKLKQSILPSDSEETPEISVTFKDGKTITINPALGKSLDVLSAFEKYSKSLKMKDDISDN